MDQADILIVGGGHGGAQAALALRQQGFAGRIVLVGRETEPPYERPPLPKEYLAREKEFSRLYIRPPQVWASKAVELRLGRPVGIHAASPLGCVQGQGRLHQVPLPRSG